MRFIQYLVETDEFERQDIDVTDRIVQLKRIQEMSHKHLMRIMDKWHALLAKGLISKVEPTKGGTWWRVPETMALAGRDWYCSLEYGTPAGKKLGDYVNALAQKESDIVNRGRAASHELQNLEREHHLKIDNATKNALNSVKNR